MTSVYIKQFYSVGKRMPDAETIPVLQLPPHTHMHFVTASCMYKYSHESKREHQSFSATLTALCLPLLGMVST